MGLSSLPSKLTVFEKTNYVFKNWHHAGAGTVVFPGCGFTSFFPKTLAALKDALRPSPDVSFAIDCCGLPLAGLKSPEAYRAELLRVEKRLARLGAREVLFFLHCDSVLPDGAFREIDEVLSRTRVGAFGIRFNKLTLVLMLCQAMSNLRVRFRHISYGDQGLFIERELFFKAGMFPDVPLMEDFQFALSLKRLGEPLGMTKHRIRTSARRFPDGEVNRLRVWVNMARLRSRYVKGASPEELALAYGNVR